MSFRTLKVPQTKARFLEEAALNFKTQLAVCEEQTARVQHSEYYINRGEEMKVLQFRGAVQSGELYETRKSLLNKATEQGNRRGNKANSSFQGARGQ